MSRKIDEPTVSRHIEVYESDWRALEKWFGRASEAKLGVSVAIRGIVRKGVREYRERLSRRAEGAAAGAAPTPSRTLDQYFPTDPIEFDDATALEGTEPNAE